MSEQPLSPYPLSLCKQAPPYAITAVTGPIKGSEHFMFLLKRDGRNVDPLHWRHSGRGVPWVSTGLRQLCDRILRDAAVTDYTGRMDSLWSRSNFLSSPGPSRQAQLFFTVNSKNCLKFPGFFCVLRRGYVPLLPCVSGLAI